MPVWAFRSSRFTRHTSFTIYVFQQQDDETASHLFRYYIMYNTSPTGIGNDHVKFVIFL